MALLEAHLSPADAAASTFACLLLATNGVFGSGRWADFSPNARRQTRLCKKCSEGTDSRFLCGR